MSLNWPSHSKTVRAKKQDREFSTDLQDDGMRSWSVTVGSSFSTCHSLIFLRSSEECQVLSDLGAFSDRFPKSTTTGGLRILETDTQTTSHSRTGQVRVSLLLLVFFFFQFLTQILSVCPLLCSSHDNTCRRNSRRQEKGGEHKVSKWRREQEVTELKESATVGERRREGGMEGGRAVVISESVPDSHWHKPHIPTSREGGEKDEGGGIKKKKKSSERTIRMSFQSYPLWWSPQNARVSQVQLPPVSSFTFVLKDTKTPLCCSSRLCFVSRSPSRCVCEVQPSPKTHQTRIKLPALSAHPPSYHSGWEMLSSCAPVQPVCGCVLLRVCVQTARPVSWKSEQHSSSKEDS